MATGTPSAANPPWPLTDCVKVLWLNFSFSFVSPSTINGTQSATRAVRRRSVLRMCTLRVSASNLLSWSPADFLVFRQAPGTIAGPLFSSEPRRVNETSEENSSKNEARINKIFGLK
jgi:hypothetical protein